MKNPKVSVIIPVYNAEKYLVKCLNSVVCQTLKDIEIICVDDGSTDKSLEILNDYAKKDSRFKIIRQQNLFAGAARNNGIKNAAGKYLVFWDSDDFFEADALSVMYSKCEKYGADICLCAACCYNSESGKKSIDESFLKKRFLPRKRFFSKDTHGKYIFNIASNVPWQRMFLASFVRENGLEFQNLRQANDTYFVMMAMYYARRITYTEKALIHYRTNNSSSITGKASAEPLCAYQSYAAVYEKLKAEGMSSAVEQSFYNRLLSGLFRGILLQTTQNGIETVYNKVKDEGLEYFGINSHLDADYYYFKNEYEDLMFIRSHTFGEYLLYKYKKADTDRLFYKAKAEKSLKIRLARKVSRLVSADSPLYEAGKRFLHFK